MSDSEFGHTVEIEFSIPQGFKLPPSLSLRPTAEDRYMAAEFEQEDEPTRALIEARAERRMGTECAVHKHSSFVPEENHHIHPLGDGGPDVASNRVRLCANAHGLVHYCLDEIRRAGSWEAVPGPVKRKFSPKVARYARMGWERMHGNVGPTG